MLYRDLKSVRLDDYLPPRVGIACALCKRQGHLKTKPLRDTYGNVTMEELAHRVAGAGGCVHQPTFCSAFPTEPDPEDWATLHQAWEGQWRCFLRCERHHEGLKRADACPGSVEIRVSNLRAMFHWSDSLNKVRRHLHCPSCGSKLIGLTWLAPELIPPKVEPNPAEMRSYERLRRVV